MGTPLPKIYLAIILGLALLTGVAFGLGLTVFGLASGGLVTPYLIVIVGVFSFLAGGMSPRLRYGVLFPISVLISTSTAKAISESFAYDTNPMLFVALTTIFYGGAAFLLFSAGWAVSQCRPWHSRPTRKGGP